MSSTTYATDLLSVAKQLSAPHDFPSTVENRVDRFVDGKSCLYSTSDGTHPGLIVALYVVSCS